jgi:2-keto-3-deoxy-L-rhamnonate aldolase RhmA
MDVIVNNTRRILTQGGIALGMGLRQARTVDIAAIAKACDFDWLFIDMEHNSMDVDRAAQIAAAALGVGISPIVRVPGHEHYHATRLLDAGAQGVVVPHVDTAQEAQAIADNCRYPPAGRRSLAGAMPQLGYKTLSVADSTRLVNQEILVVVMLETPAAIENADAIAQVPGIDVLLIGTNDLCAEMGIHGQFSHARVEAAYGTVIEACRRHGKYPGMGGVYDPQLMTRYLGMGMQLVLAGNDLSFLMAGAKERASVLRQAAAAAKAAR